MTKHTIKYYTKHGRMRFFVGPKPDDLWVILEKHSPEAVPVGSIRFEGGGLGKHVVFRKNHKTLSHESIPGEKDFGRSGYVF